MTADGAGIAKRQCENCNNVSLIRGTRETWRTLQCPQCLQPYGRPLTMGLDTVENPTAPGWPSGETIQKQRDDAYDAFVHPAKKR